MWILTNKENTMELETASPKVSNANTKVSRSPVLSRECQYGRTLYPRKILEKVPDVANVLARTKVDPQVRARLIGWLVEVMETLRTSFSYAELFRTVLIMDLYLKHYQDCIEDGDMHLIGVAAFFIGSKYETNAHVSVNDITIKACHGKFTSADIYEKEFDILKTLSFNVSYPSHWDVLRLFLYELFEDNNSVFRTIELIAGNFLLFCLMDVHFNNYMMDDLAISVIVISIKYYYSCKMSAVGGALSFTNVENYSKQEKIIVGQVYEYSGNAKQVEMLSWLIAKYLKSFKRRYQESAFAIKLFNYDEDMIRQ